METLGLVPKVPGVGNTETTPVKQKSPAKRWLFVLNNWTSEEVKDLVPKLRKFCKVAAFSKEIGESGTPHLQGYVEFRTKVRPLSLGWNKRIHWGDEKGNCCRGNRRKNLEYITKDEDYDFEWGLPKKVRVISPDYAWEQQIISHIMNEPDERKINWYWSEKGGVGKTSFCKYLVIKHKAIVLGGKAADIRNGIVDHFKENGETPELIVINIPRSFNQDYLSYEGLENIKDMLFYSGKYEGGMICGNPPHLYIFANEEPDKNKMSEDRWNIVEIDDVMVL